MIWNRNGCSREVFLVGAWAIKIPKLTYGWRMFLHGLLANMREAAWSGTDYPEICPVIFAIPGGWCTIMRRARPVTDNEFDALNLPRETAQPGEYVKSWTGGDYIIPVETKADSFGWIDGRLVAVDFGD